MIRLSCLTLQSFPKSNLGRLFIDLLITWLFSDTSDTILDNLHSFDMFVVYLHREQHQKRRYSAESLFWLPSRQQRRHKTQCLASTSPPPPPPPPHPQNNLSYPCPSCQIQQTSLKSSKSPLGKRNTKPASGIKLTSIQKYFPIKRQFQSFHFDMFSE